MLGHRLRRGSFLLTDERGLDSGRVTSHHRTWYERSHADTKHGCLHIVGYTENGPHATQHGPSRPNIQTDANNDQHTKQKSATKAVCTATQGAGLLEPLNSLTHTETLNEDPRG